MALTSRQRRGAAPAGSRQPAFVLRLLLLLGICGLAGLLLAALLLPLVGGLGTVAAAGAQTFEQYPPVFLEPALAQRSVLLDRTGKTMATLTGAEDRVVVKIDDVPDTMKRAIVAIEDSRFYEHHGIDFQGLVRALVRNGQAGQTRQGGSTLTQQYVKLALLESARTPAARAAVTDRKDYGRKLREARYALELERNVSKDQILERYLNIAYFGEGVYGVGTASLHYFSKRIQDVSLAQAALLAGLVNSPNSYDPFLHPLASQKRRDLVLGRMLALGVVSQVDEAEAKATPVPAKPRAKVAADACEGSTAPFFCDYVRTQLRQDTHFGDTQAERDRVVFGGGLRVRTTLDPVVQAAAQAAVDKVLPRDDRITAIVAAVEPGTGKVLAMAANRTYSSSKKVTGSTKLGYLAYRPIFQGGSTFKVFTLATALQKGIGLHTQISAPACYHPDPTMYDVPGPKGVCPGGFQNSDPAEAGSYDLVRGTWFSVNTFFVQLEERVGVDDVIRTAKDMGIRKEAFAGVGSRSLSVTLGAVPGNVSALDEATAYATLAARGIECDPRAMSTVVDADGHTVDVDKAPNCRRVLDEGVADTVSSVLEGVLTQEGATASGKGLPGRPAAGKTGTLDMQSAAWFAGYTPQLAMAVVLGDPAAPTTPMGTVRGVFPVFGGTLPATIWQQAMTAALDGKDVIPLPGEAAAVVVGDTTPVPDVSGLTPAQAVAALKAAGFAGVPVYSPAAPVPAGAVAGTSPGAGAGAPSGSTVRVLVSNGLSPPPAAGATPGPGPGPGKKPTAPPSQKPIPPGQPVLRPTPKATPAAPATTAAPPPPAPAPSPTAAPAASP